MTPNIPQEVMALAREIADRKYDSGARPGSWSVARDAAIAAIMEVTERAAKMLDHAYPVAEALRNWEHLKQ